MNSFVLTSESANLPIGHLLAQASEGSLTVQNENGEVVAIVLSPADFEALTYAEAERDFELHRDEIAQALARKGGITTAELLRRAESAGRRGEP